MKANKASIIDFGIVNESPIANLKSIYFKSTHPSGPLTKRAIWYLNLQESGLAPIVEPEILLDGEHGIERTFEVALKVWSEVFYYLAENNVLFEGILLKPSMVTPGAECKDRATPEQVADYTLKLLQRRIAPAVPGIMASVENNFHILCSLLSLLVLRKMQDLCGNFFFEKNLDVNPLFRKTCFANGLPKMFLKKISKCIVFCLEQFLSGGQSEVEATLNLNAMNQSPNPWHVSFSYARALQNTCLKTWGGRPENVKAAQEALLIRAKANSLAQLGKYTGEGESEEAKKGMFVKGYVY